jgi:hypothetical protein
MKHFSPDIRIYPEPIAENSYNSNKKDGRFVSYLLSNPSTAETNRRDRWGNTMAFNGLFIHSGNARTGLSTPSFARPAFSAGTDIASAPMRTCAILPSARLV